MPGSARLITSGASAAPSSHDNAPSFRGGCLRRPVSRQAGTLTAAAIVLAAVASLDGRGEPWPQWRGPSGQGISTEANLPTEWSKTKNVAWATDIPGRGFSSPIVWGNRVYLTSSIEGDIVPGAKTAPHKLGGEDFVHPDAVAGDRRHELNVFALDATTGRILWERTAYAGPVYDARHRSGSFANTTPATDGERIYVWFGSEGLYVYGLDGPLTWKPPAAGTLRRFPLW